MIQALNLPGGPVMDKGIKKRFQTRALHVPALLGFLVFISYGLLIPRMGFYWDDLPFAWFLRYYGPAEFIEAFRPFRPLLGYIFAVTTAIFGGHPLTWQVLALVVRFLLGLEVWFLLRQVWSRRRDAALWTALIFTLYPAYQQQWVAFTHINQELIPLLLLLASFLFTAWGARNNRFSVSLTGGALVLQAMGLFSTEYFFGLEVLRFLFVLVILGETTRDPGSRLKRSLQVCAPNFVVWLLSAAWTYAYHRSGAYASYEMNAFSSLSPVNLVNEILNTISLSGFTAWLEPFNLFAALNGSVTQVVAFAVFLTAAIVTGGVALADRRQATALPVEGDRFGWWAAGIGLVGIFAGRLPSWTVGLPLKIEFDYDRFFISIMLGASLFIVGLADLLLRDGRRKIALISVVVGMCAASQFSTANTYRRDWSNQQELFWQMSWRMPALREGTAVLAYDLPIQYASDLQLTAPLNWMYAPGFQGHRLPHALLFLKTRFTVSELRPNVPITLPYRTARFDGNTSNVIVVFKEAEGCLRVLDPVYNSAETVTGANPYLLRAIPLSNPEMILAEAPSPQMEENIFGSEPPHNWCWVYEKAESSRQSGDWNEIIRLYRKAQTDGLAPNLPVEYLPFIEAFAREGDMDAALALTNLALKEQKTICPALIKVWDRVSQIQDAPEEARSTLQQACADHLLTGGTPE